MKKLDVLSSMKNEADTKRIFRAINEISHYLDQQRSRSKCIIELFSNPIESHRARLCSYAEKLMFGAPLQYGRKCEEILWRKCFYDVYTTLKKRKKQDDWTRDEISLLVNVLYSGIGFYQYLIVRLQEEHQLNLDGVVEFPTNNCMFGLCDVPYDMRSSYKIDNSGKSEEARKTREWAECCVHRSLLYIGDLNRYMFDLYPGWDVSVAYRYYMKALYLKPEVGIPHNQLGTLSSTQNCTLEATYRYLRCLYSKELFDGAETNLVAIMEQYPPVGLAYNNLPLKKRIYSQFLHLIGVWFLHKSPIKDIDQLCLEFIENINVWFPEPDGNTSILRHDPLSIDELVEMKCLKAFDLPESENTIFRVLIVFIISHHRLQQKQSKVGASMVNSVAAVIIAIISRTIEYVVNKLKNALPTPPLPSEKNEMAVMSKAKRRRRRRRVLRVESLSDGESSESDIPHVKDYDDNESDDASEENLIFDEYSNDDEKQTDLINGHSFQGTQTNGFINGHSKKQKRLNSVTILNKLLQAHYHMMQVIKISCDWLICNKDVLSPISSWKAVFENMAVLLNYTSLLSNNAVDDDAKYIENIPLPEDVEVKDLQALKSVQEKMCWQWCKIISLNLDQEMKHRAHNLIEFGKFLTTIDNTIFLYDKDKHWFSVFADCKPVAEKDTMKKLDDEQRTKKMKEMGQLWLEAEVKNLEKKVKQTAETNMLTPYLVIDSEALTHHCILVKKLVSSRQFVLLVPSVVVSNLDELKKTSGRARDAIRWLESQFRQGNRFLRMQRNNEKLPIPLVPYPKKKDNEAWMFMQLMECCYYLNNANVERDEKQLMKNEEDSNLVRMLTGSRSWSSSKDAADVEKKTKSVAAFNMAAVKKSTGLLIEHITDFYNKWKNSAKSYG